MAKEASGFGASATGGKQILSPRPPDHCFGIQNIYCPDTFYLKRYEIPTSVGMDIGKIPKQEPV